MWSPSIKHAEYFFWRSGKKRVLYLIQNFKLVLLRVCDLINRSLTTTVKMFISYYIKLKESIKIKIKQNALDDFTQQHANNYPNKPH